MGMVDHVTDFKLDNPVTAPGDYPGTYKIKETHKMAKVADLIKAINAYCDSLAAPALHPAIFSADAGFEHFCCSAAWDDPNAKIPERFRWLIAFAVEGENEADYCHVGALQENGGPHRLYIDFGFTKVWGGPNQARQVAVEVQRFLNASRWN
jgi:hypothetical protein